MNPEVLFWYFFNFPFQQIIKHPGYSNWVTRHLVERGPNTQEVSAIFFTTEKERYQSRAGTSRQSARNRDGGRVDSKEGQKSAMVHTVLTKVLIWRIPDNFSLAQVFERLAHIVTGNHIGKPR